MTLILWYTLLLCLNLLLYLFVRRNWWVVILFLSCWIHWRLQWPKLRVYLKLRVVAVVMWSIISDIWIIIWFIIPNSRDQVICCVVAENWGNVIPKSDRSILPSWGIKCTFIHWKVIAIFFIRGSCYWGDIHGGIFDRGKLI